MGIIEESSIWYYHNREINMTKPIHGYFDNDGSEINPDLIPKPDLCITCKKDGLSGEEEMLCNLTRADQQGRKNLGVMLMSRKDDE